MNQMIINKAIALLLFTLLALGLVQGKVLGITGNVLIIFGLVAYCIHYHSIKLTPNEKIIGLIISCVGFTSLLSLVLAEPAYQTWNRVDHPSRYLLAVPLFWMLSQRYRLSHHVIFWGCVVGAFLAAGQALASYTASRTLHFNGQVGHHIIFGTLSLLLGIISLALSTYQEKRLCKIIGNLAFIGGMTGAFISGSRGAWLTALILSVAMLFLWKREFNAKKIAIIVFSFIIASTFFYTSFLPKDFKDRIEFRIDTIFSNIDQYQHHNNVTSSVGARFEMWQAAAIIFSQHPIVGAGPKTFLTESKYLIEKNQVRDFGAVYMHAHNQFLNTLATTGVLGFVSLLILLFAPLTLFSRVYWDSRSTKPDRAYAITGMLVCLGYIGIGLTETILDRHVGVIFYLIMVCICLSQLMSSPVLMNSLVANNKNVYFKIIICLSLGWFFLSLIFRPAHIDTAWLGEQAFWLSEVGRVKSAYFAGLLEYENQQLVYHKLFILLGSKFIDWFGYQLTLLRAIALFGFVLCCILIVFLIKTAVKQEAIPIPSHSKMTSIIICAFTLLISNALLARYVFEFRPETVLMTVGLAVFLLLWLHLTKQKIIWIILAGVLTGIGILLHLNGLIFLAAGFGLLSLQKRWLSLPIYLGVAAIVSAFYFYDVTSWQTFLMQFRYDPALKDESITLLRFLERVIDEHKRYFRSEVSFSWSIFVLAVLYCGRNIIFSSKFLRLLFVYTLIAIVSLALIAHSKTEKYLLLIMPLITVLVAILFVNIKAKSDPSKFLMATLAFYVLCQFYAYQQIWREYEPLGQKLAQIKRSIDIEDSTGILLAPMSLIVHLEPEERFRSQSLLKFLIQQKTDDPLRSAGFVPHIPGTLILGHDFYAKYHMHLPNTLDTPDFINDHYRVYKNFVTQ